MTQPALDFAAAQPLDALLARNSACARLARLLLNNRGRWIDGKQLAQIAGGYAWRTRVSNLRKAPWLLSIENRQRKVGAVTISEYRLA